MNVEQMYYKDRRGGRLTTRLTNPLGVRGVTLVLITTLLVLLTLGLGQAQAKDNESINVPIGKIQAVDWTRLAGSTRLDTMAEISNAGFDSAGTVIIANAHNFPDALSATSLAGYYGAPVLLTGTDSLDAQAEAEIKRLSATRAIIAGGEAAVSYATQDQISSLGLVVTRVSGATRYETSHEIYTEQYGNWSKTAIIASGEVFADALSISPYAYATKSPIFLSSKSGLTDQITSDIKDGINKGKIERVVIVGGDAAIPTSIESVLKPLLGNDNVKRLAGATRYNTSEEIVKWAVSEGALSYKGLAIATGENFPDSLAGGALCGERGSVIMLSHDNESDYRLVTNTLSKNATDIKYANVLGGDAVISTSLYQKFQEATLLPGGSTDTDGKTDVIDKDDKKQTSVEVKYDKDGDGIPEEPLPSATVAVDDNGDYVVTLPQEAKGKNVSVTVTDENGDPVPDKDVIAKDDDGNNRGTEKTDENGTAIFSKNTGESGDDGKTDVIDKDGKTTVRVTITYDQNRDDKYVALGGVIVEAASNGSYCVTLPQDAIGKSVKVQLQKVVTNAAGKETVSSLGQGITVKATDYNKIPRTDALTDKSGVALFEVNSATTDPSDGSADIAGQDDTTTIRATITYDSEGKGTYVPLGNAVIAAAKDGSYSVVLPEIATGKSVQVALATVTTDASGKETVNKFAAGTTVSAADFNGDSRYDQQTDNDGIATFEVLDISNAVVNITTSSDTYNNDNITADVESVVLNGKVLDPDTYSIDTNNSDLSRKNAGDYKIVITSKDPNYKGTATGNWKIQPAKLTSVEAAVVTYDGTEQTAKLTVYAGDIACTSYTVLDNSNKQTNAGEHNVTVTGQGNFEGEATGIWTINKAEIKNVTLSNPVYDRTNQYPEVLSANAGTNLTIEPSDCYVDQSETTAQSDVSTSGYTATVKVSDSCQNYTGTITTAKWNITPATIASVSAKDTIYNGDTQTAELTVTTENGLTCDADEYTVTGNQEKDANEKNVDDEKSGYTVTVKGSHNFTSSKSCKWYIEKAEITSATLDSPIYSGKEERPTVASAFADELPINKEDCEVINFSPQIYKDASGYTADVHVKDDCKNFKGTVTGPKWNIADDEIASVEVVSDEATYNGSLQSPTLRVVSKTGRTLSEDEYTVSNGEHTNAGTYDVVVSGVSEKSYGGSLSFKWTINKATIENAAVANPTYTSKPQLPTVASAYALDANNGKLTIDPDDCEVSGTRQTNVYADGVYTATVKVKAKSQNFQGSTGVISWNIEPAEITEAQAASVTYDSKQKTAVFTVKAGEENELTCTTYILTEDEKEIKQLQKTEAGDYKVKLTATGNYKGTLPVTWTIDKAEIADVVFNEELTYDGSEHGPSVVSAWALDANNNKLIINPNDCSVDVIKQTNAGTYEGSLGANVTVSAKNFKGTLPNRTWTINRATITSAAIEDVAYTGELQGPTKVASAKAGNCNIPVDACIVSVSESDKQKEVGNYNTATVTVDESKCINFKGSIEPVAWNIIPATITSIELDGNMRYTYTGGLQILNNTDVIVKAGEHRLKYTDYTLENNKQTEADTYTVDVKVNGSYECPDSLKTINWTIEPASIADATVTLSTSSFKNNDDETIDISNYVTGVKLGDNELVEGIDYKLSGDVSASAVGDYTVYATAISKNYKDTTTNGAAWEIYKTPTESDMYWLAAPSLENPEEATDFVSQATIDSEISKISSDSSIANKWRGYMLNESYHLYTRWNGYDGGTGKNQWVEFRIIGVGEHDSDDSNVTFMATHSLPTAQQMNNDISNEGSWSSSYMRNTIMNSYIKTGLNDLTAAVKNVDKVTTSGSYGSWTEGSTTQDQFWLLSNTEIFGTGNKNALVSDEFKAEGTQYTWFSNKGVNAKSGFSTENSAISNIYKTRAGSYADGANGTEMWWLRSPSVNNSGYFGCIYNNGRPGAYNASSTCAVVPAFAM